MLHFVSKIIKYYNFVTMDAGNTIGSNLKAFREAMSLSQEDVAKYLDIQRELISYYENGSRQAPLDILEKLASLFGVELYDLMQEGHTSSTKANLAFAFRTNALSAADLHVISDFKKIVRNYIKLVDLKEKNEREL